MAGPIVSEPEPQVVSWCYVQCILLPLKNDPSNDHPVMYAWPPSLQDVFMCRIALTKHDTSAWINNYIQYKVWFEITYPFPNFNGTAFEVWG